MKRFFRTHITRRPAAQASDLRAIAVRPAAILALILIMVAGLGAAPHAAGQNTTASCRVLVNDLLVRTGPGTAFPAVGRLALNTLVQGIAFVQTGVPAGSWVEVQQTPGRALGFIAADTQFVRCTPAANTLTPGRIPPTPAPTPAAPRNARTRVNGGDLSNNPIIRGPANVNNGQYLILPNVDQRLVDAVLNANGQLRFGDGLGFGVEPLDRRAGNTIGAGIAEVEFIITYFNEDGEEVTAYQTIEHNAPYCLFSDQNNQCNILRFSQMGYKWPDTQLADGAPRPLEDTFYTAQIIIRPRQGDEILWLWQFNLGPVTLEFP